MKILPKEKYAYVLLIGLIIPILLLVYKISIFKKNGIGEISKAEKVINDFESVLDVADDKHAHTQKEYFSFFTKPKTAAEQQEKKSINCGGPFPCLWVSTSSLTGVKKYQLLSLEKFGENKYKAKIKEWVIHYDPMEGKFVDGGIRENEIILIREGGKLMIERYGIVTGGQAIKYMGIY